ncbi:MAG: nucleoside triphosphate pyrophosphohydrolase [Desulfovibrio sp.]|nr:nucleoside triphosphate pyrophosphohydrolase [Desulfovibrio sp.]
MTDKFRDLLAVIDRLTAPDGCPWDREQTPLSMADYIIEEGHELVAAIRSNDPAEICEELGDVFFILLFLANYYEKRGVFSLGDALEHNRAKMIRRHPHVFGDARFENTAEFLKTWEKIKKEEKDGSGKPSGLFASLPSSLPPLVKAYRIHSKAARAGFTWPDDEEVERQVESEWLELLDAMRSENKEATAHELGDMLFSLTELGRRKGIKANEALDFAARRFLSRYAKMEELAAARGAILSELSLDEQDELWNLAKEEEEGSHGAAKGDN